MSTQPINAESAPRTTGAGLEVIVVSSTGAHDLLRACLRSLREAPYTGGPMQVHVVDNASTDGTPQMVREEFGEVTLHALDWNAGFCYANNLVLRQLQAPFALVLNPDTEVYPGSLDHMMALMQEDPTIGMSSCRLERRDGSLDHAAKRSFPTPAGALFHFLGLSERGGRFAQYKAPELGEHELGEVDAVNGAYMLVRRDAVEQVGIFDEGYWLYMEDLDWCYRFKQAGWRVVYDGRVSTLHVKGGTTVRKRHRGLKHNYAFHRSMGRFYRRYDAGKNPLFDLAVYTAIGVKFFVAMCRSTIARRSIT
ncbi:MAG TPA: glycosyltransferase family 2 protein [Solirubrobacterales bacterium]|nr:glycosyltransferase family 2 protein [Solirubrobacterales bacterium]